MIGECGGPATAAAMRWRRVACHKDDGREERPDAVPNLPAPGEKRRRKNADNAGGQYMANFVEKTAKTVDKAIKRFGRIGC